MQVSIEGLDELRDQLNNLGTELRAACHRALQTSAEAVVDDVQRHVRVNTGNLKRDINARYQNNKLVAEIGWWQRDDDYAKEQEFGTRRIPANPTLLPALERERRHLADRIRAEVRRTMP
ncbi:HK97-gp10 family putative phage morphogenesis protein [Streptomyces sp. NPDC048445]|uniref:HK97-gp10 family putative phage morphogenesis protein n=1 Tax=Streptomyces sp. NPDC048445 TaxID=3365553 RepID=UPI0037113021